MSYGETTFSNVKQLPKRIVKFFSTGRVVKYFEPKQETKMNEPSEKEKEDNSVLIMWAQEVAEEATAEKILKYIKELDEKLDNDKYNCYSHSDFADKLEDIIKSKFLQEKT